MSVAIYPRRRRFHLGSRPRRNAWPRSLNDQSGIFVLQEFAPPNRRSAFNLCLEIDGVLKRWTIAKSAFDTPSAIIAKPAADASLDSATFEGVSASGTTLVWDRGTWRCNGDPDAQYDRGKLSFHLSGEKLGGNWNLIRHKVKSKQSTANWILSPATKSLPQSPMATKSRKQSANNRSVQTGRTLREVAAKRQPAKPNKLDIPPNLAEQFEAARTRHPPINFKPQLATLAAEVPEGGNWLHEIKLDGYRILVHLAGKQTKLITRRGLDWTHRFPTLAATLAKLPLHDTVLDGEVVVLTPQGKSDFQALQNSMRLGNEADMVFFAFDLPFFAGRDLTTWPLIDRKQLLTSILAKLKGKAAHHIRLSNHIAGAGDDVAKHACRYGLEGIVSKLADSPYVQRRTTDWLKIKCAMRQEFVVGGWTNRSDGSIGVGSLLLGYYDKGELIYCGRVGTGYTEDTHRELAAKLAKVKADNPPFSDRSPGYHERGTHYVQPKLVVEIEFRAWTDSGILRHAAFKGVREDKSPRQVKREIVRIQRGQIPTMPAAQKKTVGQDKRRKTNHKKKTKSAPS